MDTEQVAASEPEAVTRVRACCCATRSALPAWRWPSSAWPTFSFSSSLMRSPPRPAPTSASWRTWCRPRFSVLGLLLMLVGVLLERERKSPQRPSIRVIDLNDRAQRSAVISFATFLIVFVMVSTAGSYKAYEFTESVAFCGQLCHTVMSPEYTAYQLSPHARVGCVECHVGAGRHLVREVKAFGQPAGLCRHL